MVNPDIEATPILNKKDDKTDNIKFIMNEKMARKLFGKRFEIYEKLHKKTPEKKKKSKLESSLSATKEILSMILPSSTSQLIMSGIFTSILFILFAFSYGFHNLLTILSLSITLLIITLSPLLERVPVIRIISLFISFLIPILIYTDFSLITILITAGVLIAVSILITTQNKVLRFFDNLIPAFTQFVSKHREGLFYILLLFFISYGYYEITQTKNFYNKWSTYINVSAIGLITGLIIFLLSKNVKHFGKLSLYIIVLVSIASLIIYGLSSLNISKQYINTTLSIIFGLLLITTILQFFYIYLKHNFKDLMKHPLFKLIYHIIFFIPCLIYSPKLTLNDEIITILTEVIIIGIYFVLPYAWKWYQQRNKIILLKDAVPIKNKKYISDWNELDVKYEYNVEFETFIHSLPSNYDSQGTKFVELFSFGNKPKFLYKRNTNTLMCMYENNELFKVKLPLQRWNNIHLKYTMGRLDVFINNELIYTHNGLITFIKNDPISYGDNPGISGGIRNIFVYKI